MSKWTNKIPSVLWIPIIIGGIALFIFAPLILFHVIGYVEGFSSIILLGLGWYGFRVGNNSDDIKGGFAVALGLTFFAAMGMALDQTGNFIYNKPIEWTYCPENSELMRETVKRGLRGGGISLSQSFACVAKNGGEVLREISRFEHFSIRFAEYLLLGYILLGLSRLYGRMKRANSN